MSQSAAFSRMMAFAFSSESSPRDCIWQTSANGYERLLLDAMLGDATLFSRRDGRDQESEKHGLVEVVRLHSYCADSERHHRKRLQGDVIVLVLKYALDLQELSMA